MNEQIKELAEQAGLKYYNWSTNESNIIDGDFRYPRLEDYKRFAELIVRECAACCGSQADKKNIYKRFELPVESDVKYQSPEAHGSVTSQYTRKYNIPPT